MWPLSYTSVVHSLVKLLHTCVVVALHPVSVLQGHLGSSAHHNNQQTRQVRLRPRMHVQGSQCGGCLSGWSAAVPGASIHRHVAKGRHDRSRWALQDPGFGS